MNNGVSASLAPVSRHPETRPLLARGDLLRFEPELTAALSRFFAFKAHSIYFPREDAMPTEPLRLSGEGKVLIPLRFQGRTLGVFAARGAKLGRGMFEHLGDIADLCMENLSLHKANLTDTLTGLFTRDYLLESAVQSILQQRAVFLSPGPAGNSAPNGAAGADSGTDETASGRAGNFGIIVIRLRGLQRLSSEYGYLFMERMLIRLAGEFLDQAPEQGLAARISDGEIGLYLPQATPRLCRKLGEELAACLAEISLAHELSGRTASVRASAGFACYPLHADPLPTQPGTTESLTALDQARFILRKARHAAYVAAQDLNESGRPLALAFDQILTSGGRVKGEPQHNLVKISLGRDVGARTGQCFAVWGADPLTSGFNPLNADSTTLASARYRGELVLIAVADAEASAELFYQADPLHPIQPGDYLTLLPEGAFQYTENTVPETGNAAPGTLAQLPETGLNIMGLPEFTARFRIVREKYATCSLSLLRLDILNWSAGDNQPLHLAGLMAHAAELCAAHLPREILPQTLAGTLGMHSFLFFHPHLNAAQALELYYPLTQALRAELSIDCACGIATYPYLDSSRADLMDMARKALAYAALLPEPRVGVFNSLALNINADRLYSQGDAFAAIQEYKRALLADESNTMAWTSLGVCLAGVGRKNDARACFERALALAPQDVMVLYNLGQINQDIGELKNAAAFYRRCLKYDANHVYAALRLGSLAEQAGSLAKARRWYGKALELPGGQGPAQRRLASLALSVGNLAEAREHLHQALLADPHDAAALTLLARLYLDAGEDAEVALSLARQSVALRPESRGGWQELSRAYERAGHPAQAAEAAQKAGHL